MTTAVIDARKSTSSLNAPAAASVFVFGRRAAGWRVGQPLPIVVARHDDGFLVSDPIFNVFGEGRSWDEAEADFVASLVDYFLLLAEANDEPTRHVVEHLKTYLHPDRD